MNGTQGMRLTEPLPESVMADGREIPVRTDFRRWLLVLRLLGDDTVPDGVKEGLLPKLACPSPPPAPTRELTAALCSFAALGQPLDGGNAEGAEAAFDFDADAGLILASFRQAYRIDLTAPEPLHWWVFLTLLRHLPPESVFMQTVRLRLADPSEIEDDRLRRRLRRAQRSVRLTRGARGGG